MMVVELQVVAIKVENLEKLFITPKHMTIKNCHKLGFNLGFPCIGAVSYDEDSKDFKNGFSNHSNPERYHTLAAL